MSSPSQVAVFWDYENCRPPSNVSGFSVVDRIRRIVQDFGNTTVFKAYVDLSLECANARSMIHSELQSSGLSIIHCPHNGRKDVADKMMLVDMLAFAIDSPAPATIVLITGDRDFAYAAAILRLRGYEVIIIASSFIAHASLKSQGCRLYDWQKVVVGNDGSPAAKAGDIRADESLLTETTALSTGLLVSTSLPSYSKSKHAVPTTNTSTKSSTTKKSASKPAAGHPSWADMIRECIIDHPEEACSGVSRPQIKKYVETKYGIRFGAAQVSQLNKAIAHGAERGTFVLPKGLSGKVKLPPKRSAESTAIKENKPAPAIKPTVKTTAKPKSMTTTTAKAKPTTAKAAVAKKGTAAKAATKHASKSSTAAKKAPAPARKAQANKNKNKNKKKVATGTTKAKTAAAKPKAPAKKATKSSSTKKA